jgi:Zn-dependent protease with chaperone function
MRYERYVSLIQKLEKSADDNAAWYRFKVFLLMVVGYAYFGFLILLFFIPLAAVAGVFVMAPGAVGRLLLYTSKLWWALIPGLGAYFGFIGSALRSVTARVSEPEGKELSAAEAPELFDLVRTTASALSARRPAKILIDNAFNAAVVTIPRFGIFGQKVLLIIGLPLMRALSPEQFKAVIAHEMGHISGKHGAFAKWAYQMTEAWNRLLASQASVDHKFGSLYQGFIDRFIPFFAAYSFVLMREHEKDADRGAVELAGAKPLGEALLLMDIKAIGIAEDFWPEIQRQNITRDTPPEKLFTTLLDSLAFHNGPRSAESLRKAIAVPTDFSDTHPSLADRLRLIGYWTTGELPPMPNNEATDAAAFYLGESAAKLAQQFDEEWHQAAREPWLERYRSLQESQKRISELEERRSSADLSHEEMRELARLLTDREGIPAARSVIEEAAARFPDDAIALYNLGLVRLEQDDDGGLILLDKAADIDRSLKFDTDQMSFAFLRRKGRFDEAKRYANSIDDQAETFKKAENERNAVLPGDKFEISDLPHEFLDSIPAKLAGLDEITSLYAVHKQVEYMREFPLRVLFIAVRKKGRIRNRHDADAATILSIVMQRLSTGEFHYFVLLQGKWAGTQYYLERISGARFYHRSA